MLDNRSLILPSGLSLMLADAVCFDVDLGSDGGILGEGVRSRDPQAIGSSSILPEN
jgi:hypothetical protein